MMAILDYIFEENNPAGIKTVLKELGMCSNQVRLPLVKASEGLHAKIRNFVKTF
jgi:4-hydroxy-tetrahydrodipicolinate synthase